MLLCVLFCYRLCSNFYISLAHGPRKQANLYVLLLDISPSHSNSRANSSSLHQNRTLYLPISSLIFPLWQENLPCSSALRCQRERLLAGWAKKDLKGNFKCTSSDCIITGLKREGKGLSILTYSFPSAASKIIESRKYCWFEGWPSASILHKSSWWQSISPFNPSQVLTVCEQPVFCSIWADLKVANCFNIIVKIISHGIWITSVACSQSSYFPAVLWPV